MPVERSQIGDGTVIHHPELVNIYDAFIGRDCIIAAFVEIGGAALGNDVRVQAHCFIPERVIIESDVFVGPGVIFCNDKYPPSYGKWREGKPTLVKSKASIGAGSIILPGVTIGVGARVGAGAIVTKDVKDGELWILAGESRKS